MSRTTSTVRPPPPLAKPPLPRTKGKKGGGRPERLADPKREELRRGVAIDGHLARIRALLADYQLDRRTQPKIFQLLGRIEEHEREERLFLGVVGEFSSGKSTLLNALLRDDLLRTDIIQGTTAAPTVLSYGPALAVAVRKNPRHPVIRVFLFFWLIITLPIALFRPRRPRDREGLRVLIHESSAVEEVARTVAQVNVSHPAESLKNGMVIIDLPGTNAENPRHGLVTAAALTDFCDAAVIVIAADVPASETLLAFLTNSLEPEVLRRCVFVVNKIDKIRRQRDREQLIQNLKARLKMQLSIENPRVVEAAPERVLEAAGILQAAIDAEFAMTAEENAYWITAFEKTERLLLATLQEQKLLLQVERLARLLGRVFDTLAGVLKTRDGEFRDQHAALLEGLQQIPDLEQFVADARGRHCGAYAKLVEPLLRSCGKTLGQIQAATLRSLAETIFATTNRKTLQQALEGSVQSIMSSTQSSLRSALRATIAALEKGAEEEHRKFHKHFQNLFRNLATLGGRVRTETRGLDAGASKSFASGTGSAPVALAENVAQLRQEEFLKSAGGAGLGAVMGTMMLPGVGTLIGGVLGGLFGLLFGPSHQEIAQRCWSQLETAVQNGFEQFLQQAQANLDRAAEEIAVTGTGGAVLGVGLAVAALTPGIGQLVAAAGLTSVVSVVATKVGALLLSIINPISLGAVVLGTLALSQRRGIAMADKIKMEVATAVAEQLRREGSTRSAAIADEVYEQTAPLTAAIGEGLDRELRAVREQVDAVIRHKEQSEAEVERQRQLLGKHETVLRQLNDELNELILELGQKGR